MTNFNKHKINEADAFFVFMVDKVIKRTSEKLASELPPSTPIASYGFEPPNLNIIKTLNTKPSKTYF